MLYNEEAVRANIRNREGKRVYYLGKGDQLTSGARDFLTRERIEILPADQARPQTEPARGPSRRSVFPKRPGMRRRI